MLEIEPLDAAISRLDLALQRFARRFSGTAAARAASDSIGLAYNIRELLGVLDSIRQATTADE